ncbi:uncharacterized protein LOC131675104 [Phymastichus coffea]|uniref:uncharacterized protein LOC131675104 n=1 Tax=Phymastichus coffea TaxID=108790 RepID=UPI00273B1D20|nr:uncharacterized protein LOC131675104 [Phymastichus coffea]
MYLEKMCQAGIIEPAISQYCNPFRIVRKSDGAIRVCLDARNLNKYLEEDHEAPPIITDIMQVFFKCKYFSKIDMTMGYWQILLDKESRPLTAFVFKGRMYQFIRVPFGISTASSAFIRAFTMALSNQAPIMNIFERQPEGESNTEKENNQHILGVCNYYQRFAIKHNNFISLFRDLLKDNSEWLWTEQHTRAFDALKRNFTHTVCLSHVIPNIPFKVQTDASNSGIAGILYQIDENKEHGIISLASRCLTQTGTKYTTTELELLSIVYSIAKFRRYLIKKNHEEYSRKAKSRPSLPKFS